MAYEDEKIIQMMNIYKAELHEDIYAGMYMKGELLKFQKEYLFDDNMSIMLPESFIDMPEEMIKIKYLMEQRPKIIKTNEAYSVNFTFNLLPVDLVNEQVSNLLNIFQNTIKSTQPSYIFYEKKVEQLALFTLGWFDFKSHGVDAKIYNLMYCLPVAGKVMHGVFNCPMAEAELWKPCALQVMHSIEDLTIEKMEQEAGSDER